MLNGHITLRNVTPLFRETKCVRQEGAYSSNIYKKTIFRFETFHKKPSFSHVSVYRLLCFLAHCLSNKENRMF
jgi:hypothetical protein